MKLHEIKKTRSGWISARVVCPGNKEVGYDYFLNKKEAKIWCYAKLNSMYGREIAEECVYGK